jgi:hypothetical protein
LVEQLICNQQAVGSSPSSGFEVDVIRTEGPRQAEAFPFWVSLPSRGECLLEVGPEPVRVFEADRQAKQADRDAVALPAVA